MASDRKALWTVVEKQARQACHDAGHAATDAIRNALDFIAYAPARYPAPESVSRGYWPTVCLDWPLARPSPIQIEIAGDQYEFYRFINHTTDIEHFAHIPGEPFPDRLAAILDEAIGD